MSDHSKEKVCKRYREGRKGGWITKKPQFQFLFSLLSTLLKAQIKNQKNSSWGLVIEGCVPQQHKEKFFMLVTKTACSFTYQLKLPATIVGVLYARVHPQSFNGGQVLQEDGGLQLPAGHLSRPGVERHQVVPMPLIVLVTPWDVQLFPGIHQHTYAWRGSAKVRLRLAHWI